MYFNNTEDSSLVNEGFRLLHNAGIPSRLSLKDAEEYSNQFPYTVINFIDDSKKDEYFNSRSPFAYEFDNIEDVVRDYLKIDAVVNVLITNDNLISKENLMCAVSSLRLYSRYLTESTSNIISLIVSEKELKQGLIATLNLMDEGIEEEKAVIFINNQLVKLNIREAHGHVLLNSLEF